MVSAVFGIGTALIVLALGSYILPVKETIALATVLFTASTISKSVLYSKQIDWKLVCMMSVASLPFAYWGATLMTDVPGEILRKLLGAMLLLYVGMSAFKLLPKVNIGTPGLLAGSAAYGFLSGLLGSGNLIKAILFREMNITKEAFVGAMAATSVVANIVKIIAYTDAGLLNAKLKLPAMGLAIAAVSAVAVGRCLLGGIGNSQFSIGLQIILGISAIGLLL